MNWRERVGSWLGIKNAGGGWLTPEAFGNFPSAAGYAVSTDSAMRLSAVYRSVAIISGAIASLPLPVYRRIGEDREKVRDAEYWLLNERPTPAFSAAAFWEYMLRSMLLNGDGFAYVRRDGINRGAEFIPMDPRKVTPRRDGNDVVYDYVDNENRIVRLDSDSVLHFPTIGFDGLKSQSVISYAARQTIGTSLATEDHAGRLFSNGGTSRVVLKFPNSVKQDQVDGLRAQWTERYGGTANSHLPMVLTNGGDATAISLTAVDQQLLESRRFHVEDIARAFGVPPHMIGHTDKTTSWGSGIEQMSIGFVQYTLQPHLRRIEQELNHKLFKTSRLFVEFNVDGLLRGDSKSRGDFYRQAIGGSQGPGWMKRNEVRRLENLPQLDEADSLFVPTGSANANQNSPTDPSQP